MKVQRNNHKIEGVTRGILPVVTSRWTWRDRFGALAARCRLRRAGYRIKPGLYAIGAPTLDSPVLVTANYKLTFDHLRLALAGIDAWILVLNTRGVNVWCAAAKGTFGTDELVKKIRSTRLSGLVRHATLILPQLGASGVAAHEVARQTGFSVVYGPVRAADIPSFLRAGMQCTPAMRRVTFPLADRLAVVPPELARRLRPVLGVWLFFLLLAAFRNRGVDGLDVLYLRLALGVGSIFLAGAVLVPALLPWLPGRAFAVKGAVVGLGVGLLPAVAGATTPQAGAGFLLLAMAACSYLGLMFTGSATYTSVSGARQEVRRAVPLQLAVALIGTVLWCI